MSGTGPVFVLGPERSGANLLAWSLGQHQSFTAGLSTSWLGSLPADLHRAYGEATVDDRAQLAATGVTRAEFYRAFGEATIGLLTRSPEGAPGRRLVDATPDHAFNVFALRWLYPDARFIHVVRDVSSVVRLLLDKEVSKLFRTYHRENKAYEHWLSTVRACLQAERALGSQTVLRVLHRDLVTDAERTLRRCFDFVGETWDRACLRALDGVSADTELGPARDDESVRVVPFRDEAEALSAGLLESPMPCYPPDLSLIEQLERSAFEMAARSSAPTDVGALGHQVRDIVEGVLPVYSHVLVVSRGDDRLLELNDRTAGHFPQGDDGHYLGYHPADSADAISRLEVLRASGAQYLVIPSTAFWWLDHYDDFRRHLDERYTVVAHRPDVCVVYSLEAGAAPGLDLASSTADAAGDDASFESLALRLQALEAELPLLRSRLAAALTGVAHNGRSEP